MAGVNLNPDLVAWLTDVARDNGRHLSEEVEFRLTQSLKGDREKIVQENEAAFQQQAATREHFDRLARRLFAQPT